MLPSPPLGEEVLLAHLHARAEGGLSWRPSALLRLGEPQPLVFAVGVLNVLVSFFFGSDGRTLA